MSYFNPSAGESHIEPSDTITQLSDAELITKYNDDITEVREDARELLARIGSDDSTLEYGDFNDRADNVIDLVERFEDPEYDCDTPQSELPRGQAPRLPNSSTRFASTASR